MKTSKRVSILLGTILVGTLLFSTSKAQALEPTQDFLNKLKGSPKGVTSTPTLNQAKTIKQELYSNNLLSLTSQELVTNGNFEASPLGYGWNDPYGSIGNWSYTYSGSRSAFIGYTASTWKLIYQNLTVPINSKTATASFKWRMYSFETLSGYDSIQFRVLKTSDLSVAYCSMIYDPVYYAQGTWWVTNCDVSAARGEDVTVVVGVDNDSSLGTWIYADDVSIVAQLDTTAPTTTASINPISPDGSDGWYKNTPLVSLIANDDADGMGLMDSIYWIDDPYAYQIYSGPFAIPDGIHTVYYMSVDNGWNFENENSFTIKVDTTKPIITLNGNSIFRVAQNTTYSEPGATATDAIDSAVAVTPTGAVDTTTLGDYIITYNATDQAGNVAEPVTRTVRVVTPSDISALTAAIANAQTVLTNTSEGDVPGQKPVGTKAILQIAITVAQGITTAYLQSDVDAAVITLNNAVTTLINTPNVPPSNLGALSAAIASAQTTYINAVEGTSPGQYPAPLKANLLAAINTALAITSAQAQAVVDAAIAPLNNAVATFLAGVVPTPPPAPPAPVVTPPAPIPQVLGATTTRPIIKGLTVTKGVFSFKLNGVTKKIYPYGKTYKGTVWGKSVDFGPDGKLFVFVNSQAYSKGQIKVYRSNGKLLKAYNPYGGFATNGLNATAVVESNDKVYLAVATTKSGTTVKTYQLTAKGLTTLNSLKATKSAGNIKVAFKKLYKTQYGLVTMKEGDRSTLKVWKLNLTTNKFVEDKKINKSKLTI